MVKDLGWLSAAEAEASAQRSSLKAQVRPACAVCSWRQSLMDLKLLQAYSLLAKLRVALPLQQNAAACSRYGAGSSRVDQPSLPMC